MIRLITGNEAHRDAEDDRNPDSEPTRIKRGGRAVDQATERVAAEIVSTEPVGGREWRQGVIEGLRRRRIGRDKRRRDRDACKHDEVEKADRAASVA
jgi:hypothetical protein